MIRVVLLLVLGAGIAGGVWFLTRPQCELSCPKPDSPAAISTAATAAVASRS